jgi:hypothetical protein
MMSSESRFALSGIMLQGARKRHQAKVSTTDVLAGLRFEAAIHFAAGSALRKNSSRRAGSMPLTMEAMDG